MRRIPLLVLVAATVFVAAAAGRSAAPTTVAVADTKVKRTNLARSDDLWATINVCDTSANPDTIGIRGSMPGLGDKRSRLEMRFKVQYRDSEGRWRYTDDSADSGWQKVGKTLRQVVESGQNFTFTPPDEGSHELRGAVRFRWIRDGETAGYQQRFTEAGHRSTAGADPKGYSAGLCEIS